MSAVKGIFFPQKPTFTEKDVQDLTGKVAIVTGSTAGVGYALAKILYSKNATVYVCGRSSEKAASAIESIQKEKPQSSGALKPLIIELGDFDSVRQAASVFLAQEKQLHLLIHNAGVMTPPEGSKSKSGHDLELATNCLGPHLFTSLLEPVLIFTAKAEATSAPLSPPVRTIWVASLMSVGTPKGAMLFESNETGKPKQLRAMENYMQSKVGVVFLAAKWAQKLGDEGILSLCLHPGMMRTELQRNMPAPARWMMGKVFKPPIYGAFTELFAALSPTLKLANNGDYIMPWGYVSDLPVEIADGKKSKEDGGSGKAGLFWTYVQQETALRS